MDCLDLFALNVSADFASKNLRSFCKSPPHSAHRSLEPQNVLLVLLTAIKKEVTKVTSFFIWAAVDSNLQPFG